MVCVPSGGQESSQQTCNPTQAGVTEPEPPAEPALSLLCDIRAPGSLLNSSNLRTQEDVPGPSVYFLLLTISPVLGLGAGSYSFPLI